MGENFQKVKKSKRVIAYLWKILPNSQKLNLILLYFASFLKSVSELLVPLAVSVATARIQGSAYQIFGLTIRLDMSITNLIIMLFSTMFLFFTISIVMNTIIKLFGTKCMGYINAYLSGYMLDDKLNSENYTNGELAYIIKSSGESVNWYLEIYFSRFLVPIFTAVTSLAYIASMNMTSFTIVVASLVLIGFLIVLRVVKNKKILQTLEVYNAKLNNNFLNDLKNISFINFLGSKQYELGLIKELNKNYFKTDKKKTLIYMFYWIACYVIEFVCSLVAILLIIETLPTELMLSVVVLLIPYLMKVYTAIESLGFTIVQLQQHSIKVMRAEQIIKNKKDDNVVEDNNLVIKEQIESIKINKLKWYKFAFKDIAFYRGKINCLQGKNGCGKTSMIKCLLGLKDYDEASFVVNEKYNVKNLYNYKEKIGISFQDDMFFDRPIVDNIMYPKKQLNKKAKELVGVFNLNEVLKRKDKQNFFNTEFENNFSGGEKKKMSLIRNLKDDKEIYIFDEPTNDLDAQSIDNFIEIIKELCNKDKMIIIISHDKKILQVSDNIIKL